MPTDKPQQPPETPSSRGPKYNFTREQWDRIFEDVRQIVAADRVWEAEHRQRQPETQDEEILSRLD
ncbi:MAG TPA: hypothetical protein PLF81_05200 [Candidatus Anammoximicrobium sp.]|nr:hypothetical protein [Candidatus Anammoximicrobium sp.]